MIFQNLKIKHACPIGFGSQLADLSLLKSYLNQRQERRRMAGKGQRSQALHTYMGIELHKVDTGERGERGARIGT